MARNANYSRVADFRICESQIVKRISVGQGREKQNCVSGHTQGVLDLTSPCRGTGDGR